MIFIPVTKTIKNNIKTITNYIIIMENNNTVYFKTDDNRIINENCIRWVKK